MDLEGTDFRAVDVFRRVSRVSFCYYSDAEARELSVKRLTRVNAFDDLGRPVPSGLYDASLGPTSYTGGACSTCGLPYNTCPGHFGHIELPVPLVHPLLARDLLALLKASCWHCARFKHLQRTKRLLLARLRFEQVEEVECAEFVHSYRLVSSHKVYGGVLTPQSVEEQSGSLNIAERVLRKLVKDAPSILSRALEGVDPQDQAACDAAILSAAEKIWCSFRKKGRYNETPPSNGWNATVSELLLAGKSVSKCPNCGEKDKAISLGDNGSFYFGKSKSPEAILGSIQLEQYVKRLWDSERDLLDIVFGLAGNAQRKNAPPLDHTLFFVRSVLVPPSRFRPSAAYGNTGLAAEHPQNIFFERILLAIESLIGLKATLDDSSADLDVVSPNMKGRKSSSSRSRSLKTEAALCVSEMQLALNNLYDSPGDVNSKSISAPGIRQQLETKQGLFRMHLMGKRVNFSCRSVIGPDVFLDTNEVGIPESFAKLLTVPESVTPENVDRLRRAVLNGPDKYPGANAVEDWNRNGLLQTVRFRSSEHRRLLHSQSKLLLRNVHAGSLEKSIAKKNHAAIAGDPHGQISHNSDFDGQILLPKRVLRHLRTGDTVLFNRQPTLHRVSMMAHKVRILPDDRTIRFHYANCRSYNADFDGDEMNVHVPQDDIAKSEANELMLSDRHYVAPTSGAPIRDLIQDHILSAALLSNRDCFFPIEVFCQLLFAATERMMSGRYASDAKQYAVPAPAIFRPQMLWTGKQLFSAILNIVRGSRPGLYLESRSRVKADVIGAEESKVLVREGELLSGVLDKNAFGASKHGLVHAVQELYGNDAAGAFLSAVGRLCTAFLRIHGHTTGVDDLVLNDDAEQMRRNLLTEKLTLVSEEATCMLQEAFAAEERSHLDTSYPILEQTNIASSVHVLEKILRSSGAVAEGRLDAAMTAKLNTLSSEVNRLIPAGLPKKFPRNGFALMTDTGAKGSTVNSSQISCLLGSTIMEGRRVPRMGGSGATLPCFAPYDAAPNAGGFVASRFLTGISPHEFFFHAMAGREGLLDTSLKTANSGYLQRCLVKHLEGVHLHYDSTIRDSDGSVLQFRYGDDGLDPCRASWLSQRLEWQIDNMHALNLALNMDTGDEEASDIHAKHRPRDFDGEERPDSYPGISTSVVSTRFRESVDSALKKYSGDANKRMKSFLYRRYAKACAEPGDPVGVIAAQSVGEPSTQMTLNTFHHAGSESKHVTLGIPRLREILMTAAKYPKTPSMTLPILKSLGARGAREMSKRFSNVAFSDILEKICIKEGGISYAAALGGVAVRKYSIVLHLLDERSYSEELGFGVDRVKHTAKNLVTRLHGLFTREIKRLSKLEESASRHGAPSQRARDAQVIVNETDIEELSNDVSKDIEDTQQNGNPRITGSTRDALVEDDAQSDILMDDDDESEDDRSDMDDFADDAGFDSDGEKRADIDVPDTNETSPKDGKSVRWARSETRNTAEGHRTENTLGSPITSAVERAVGSSIIKSTGQSSAGTEMDEDGGSSASSSQGLVGNVIVSKAGRTVEFAWNLPQERMGQLRITELILEAAESVKLAHVDGISRCFTEELSLTGTEPDLAVTTEGSNLVAAIKLGDGLLDLNSVQTNDLYGILQMYGVEALRTALIRELKKIFEAYGIDVDVRHLSLIADYMTAHGGYRGFNRGAMSNVPSVFQQMSFETTMQFMSKAVKVGRSDRVLNNPSVSISLGEVCPGGTGAFDLLSAA